MSRYPEHIMHAIFLLSISQHMKCDVPSFTHSKDMTGAPQFKI